MADNCHDLYSKSYMMRSMTTITSSNGKINDQGGASTCLKLTYLRLLIPRLLLIVNAPIQPLANRKQPRKLHQHWEECRKRKHHRQRHGEQLKPLLRKTSSSHPAKEGWKRSRKRWKILFTPWRRLEPTGILWMGI